jgi:hypothetical protein
MSLNVGDQECNSGKKYGQKGTLCGPNNPKLYIRNSEDIIIRMPIRRRSRVGR